MIFMVLEAKNALGRVQKLNEDLLDIRKSYFEKSDAFLARVERRGLGDWLRRVLFDGRHNGGQAVQVICEIQFETTGDRDGAFGYSGGLPEKHRQNGSPCPFGWKGVF